MSYSVVVEKKAIKEIENLSESLQDKIEEEIDGLKTNPFSGRKLQGKLRDYRRISVEEHRILYIVDKANKKVAVVKVEHRSSVYRFNPPPKPSRQQIPKSSQQTKKT